MPKPATLRRYGLSLAEWVAMLPADGLCPICETAPKNNRWVTDHEHRRGWAKMPPHVRKTYVRSLVCNYCNHRILHRGVTEQKAYNAYLYFKAYRERTTSCAP